MLPSKNRLATAYAAAVIGAVIVGFSFLFVKMALTVSNPMDILAHRFTLSIAAALILLFFGRIRLTLRPQDLLTLLPLALFYPALFFAFQAYGLLHTSSSEAGIIHAAVPILTMLLAGYFLKEYSSVLQKFLIVLSVAGVIFIFAMKGIDLENNRLQGTSLMVLSALCLAGYNILTRKMAKKFSTIELTCVMTLIGFIVFNGLALIRHLRDGTLNLFFQPFESPIFVLSLLYLGVLSSLVTSFLSNYALSHIEASQMSVFSNLSTLVAVLAGVVFLEEKLFAYHILGGLAIIAGVVGTNYLTARKQRGRAKGLV
jgi:drug/metabolite transporter (DMT)-like permease